MDKPKAEIGPGSLFPARPHQIFHIERVHNGTPGKSEAASRALTSVDVLTFCGIRWGLDRSGRRGTSVYKLQFSLKSCHLGSRQGLQ